MKLSSMTKREYLLRLKGVVMAILDKEKEWRMGLGCWW